jgi:hypothetical protein
MPSISKIAGRVRVRQQKPLQKMNLRSVRELDHALLLEPWVRNSKEKEKKRASVPPRGSLSFLPGYIVGCGSLPWPSNSHTINSVQAFLSHKRSASLTGTRESSSPCAIESGTVIFSALFNGEIRARKARTPASRSSPYSRLRWSRLRSAVFSRNEGQWAIPKFARPHLSLEEKCTRDAYRSPGR